MDDISIAEMDEKIRLERLKKIQLRLEWLWGKIENEDGRTKRWQEIRYKDEQKTLEQTEMELLRTGKKWGEK